MYCEKLSEQLTVADSSAGVSTSSGSTTITGAAIDGINYNRLIAYSIVDYAKSATGVTWQIQWQASTTTTFGTATTITTCSGTDAAAASAITTVLSCEISGEQVQSARIAEDRYVRAVVTGIVASAHTLNCDLLVLGDAKRYHPQ